MDTLEQRWAKEDAERDTYRKQYVGEASAEKLASLIEIWAETDRRRLKKRVSTRKEAHKVSRQKLSERREREDERIHALHQKQDDKLSEKWKFEDIKRIAKRKAQGHLIYLRRCEQAFKLAERRREEDERHGLGREDRLGSAPNSDVV